MELAVIRAHKSVSVAILRTPDLTLGSRTGTGVAAFHREARGKIGTISEGNDG
jgi:hypothetical protein